jgi:hypothetical protein
MQGLGANAVLNCRIEAATTMNRLIVGLHTTVICYGTVRALIAAPAGMHHLYVLHVVLMAVWRVNFLDAQAVVLRPVPRK